MYCLLLQLRNRNFAIRKPRDIAEGTLYDMSMLFSLLVNMSQKLITNSLF
jgi:hypothetical protein